MQSKTDCLTLRILAQRLLTALETLETIVKCIGEDSKVKPPKPLEVTILNSNLRSLENNFTRLSTNSEYYTSSQRNFKDLISNLVSSLKSVTLQNLVRSARPGTKAETPEEDVSLWLLLETYDTLKRSRSPAYIRATELLSPRK